MVRIPLIVVMTWLTTIVSVPEVVVDFLLSQTTFSGKLVSAELAAPIRAVGDTVRVPVEVEVDAVPVLVSVQGA